MLKYHKFSNYVEGFHLLFVCDIGQAFPRVPGIANGLVRLGHNVSILTPRQTFKVKEDLKILEKEVKVIYTFGYSSYKSTFFFPRMIKKIGIYFSKIYSFNLGSKLNRYFLERKLKDYTRNTSKIDVIITSHAPFYPQEILSKSQSKLNIAWIADQRDLWSLNHVAKPTELHAIEKERFILSSASLLTTVSKPLAIQLSQLFDGEIDCIHNGYLTKKRITASNFHKEKIVLEYSGQIYEGFQDFESPINAFRRLNDRIGYDFYQLSFTGICCKQIRTHYKRKKQLLPSFVNLNGNLSHAQAVSKMEKADLFLLFEWEDLEEKGVLNKKLFEYMSYQKIVVVTGSNIETNLQDILSECGLMLRIRSDQDYDNFDRQVRIDQNIDFSPNQKIIDGFYYDAVAKQMEKSICTAIKTHTLLRQSSIGKF
jgi:hypothetical protein